MLISNKQNFAEVPVHFKKRPKIIECLGVDVLDMECSKRLLKPFADKSISHWGYTGIIIFKCNLVLSDRKNSKKGTRAALGQGACDF